LFKAFFDRLKLRSRSIEGMNDKEVFNLTEAAAYLGVPPLQMRTLATTGRATYARIDRLHWNLTARRTGQTASR
jgi:hypothetical protein